MKHFIKICGITDRHDALLAAQCGAGAIGLIFAPESPRRVDLAAAEDIASALPDSVAKIGVFVNERIEFVNKCISQLGLAYAQLHGEEQPDYCRLVKGKVIKAIRVSGHQDLTRLTEYAVEAVLLDTFLPGKRGGTGKVFDWSLAVTAKEIGLPIILSGGLNPENVVEAIEIAQPAGVDANSGVESSPGKKDPGKVEAFVSNAVHAFERISSPVRYRQSEK
jgi:phosphoribosylanthranilate isomerase